MLAVICKTMTWRINARLNVLCTGKKNTDCKAFPPVKVWHLRMLSLHPKNKRELKRKKKITVAFQIYICNLVGLILLSMEGGVLYTSFTHSDLIFQLLCLLA